MIKIKVEGNSFWYECVARSIVNFYDVPTFYPQREILIWVSMQDLIVLVLKLVYKHHLSRYLNINRVLFTEKTFHLFIEDVWNHSYDFIIFLSQKLADGRLTFYKKQRRLYMVKRFLAELSIIVWLFQVL